MSRVLATALLALVVAASPVRAGIRFEEVSQAWGLSFRHHHGGSGERYMVETMVGGVAVLDYDGDGDEDVLYVDGGVLPGYQGETPRTRLFRNDGPHRFVDVTDAAGLDFAGYGCGATAGDYDGDGDLDLYLTAFGRNALYRNQGNGRFLEAAAAAGVADTLWSASAAFADTDRDGDLDLYVANYVDFSVETHKFCGDKALNLQGYCHPGAYDGLLDTFYRNRGDGSFADATQEAGFGKAAGAGLGVVFGDVDQDGWPDLYVANDADSNFLFHNRGDGTFEDLSLLSGTAYGDRGNPEAGMGVDIGDVDGDGLPEIVVTNFELETNGLYKNQGNTLFSEGRFLTNVAEASLLKLAFGVDLADLDDDGDLDLVIANGHILDNAEEFNENSRYRQENQVFENSQGHFTLDPDSGMDVVRASRGLATGDLDRDGDLDVVVINSNDLSEVWENVTERRGGWMQVDLRAEGGNRFGLGAKVAVTSGGSRRLEEVRSASSYLSQNSLTLHFGLAAGRAEALEVVWPSGKRLRVETPAAGRLLLVEPR